MKTRRQIVLGSFALAAACMSMVAGCKSTQQHTSMGVMNSKCPISGGALKDTSPTLDYKGGKVGFCCNGCVGKWGAMSPEKQAELMAKAK